MITRITDATVLSMLVDGRMLVRDGAVIGVDDAALLDAADAAAGAAWSRFHVRHGAYVAAY